MHRHFATVCSRITLNVDSNKQASTPRLRSVCLRQTHKGRAAGGSPFTGKNEFGAAITLMQCDVWSHKTTSRSHSGPHGTASGCQGKNWSPPRQQAAVETTTWPASPSVDATTGSRHRTRRWCRMGHSQWSSSMEDPSPVKWFNEWMNEFWIFFYCYRLAYVMVIAYIVRRDRSEKDVPSDFG